MRRSGRFTADSWAWIALPSFVLGGLGYVLGKFLASPLHAPTLRWLLGLFGVLVGLPASVWVYRSFSLERRRTTVDAQSGDVQIIHVLDPIVVTQEEYNDEGPIYYLDIGMGQLLLLWGQWVYDSEVFPDSPWHASSPDDESGIPFPTSDFRLHRSPSSGRVLRVELSGVPITPIKVLKPQDVVLSGLRESELFAGSLSDLPSAIRAASMPSSSVGGA